LGLFGWKSAPRTQVASADSNTLERGAHPAATGSILAPKIKFAPQVYTVASASSDEPYRNDSAKTDVPEMQETPTALPEFLAQQQAASALARRNDSTVSMVPTEVPSSFESRWSGLQMVEAGLAFNARWALESQDSQ